MGPPQKKVQCKDNDIVKACRYQPKTPPYRHADVNNITKTLPIKKAIKL